MGSKFKKALGASISGSSTHHYQDRAGVLIVGVPGVILNDVPGMLIHKQIRYNNSRLYTSTREWAATHITSSKQLFRSFETRTFLMEVLAEFADIDWTLTEVELHRAYPELRNRIRKGRWRNRGRYWACY